MNMAARIGSRPSEAGLIPGAANKSNRIRKDKCETNMSTLGYHHTEEALAKISAASRARHASDETRARDSLAKMGNTYALGCHRSDETKARISAAEKGKIVSAETCMKMSISRKGVCGKPKTPEWRAKIAASEKGKIVSLETCAKISAANWNGGVAMSNRKHNAKRRILGFTPLNVLFSGCEGHHIDKEFVVYIPAILHQGIKHNVWTGKNMDKINALAYEWLAKEQN